MELSKQLNLSLSCVDNTRLSCMESANSYSIEDHLNDINKSIMQSKSNSEHGSASSSSTSSSTCSNSLKCAKNYTTNLSPKKQPKQQQQQSPLSSSPSLPAPLSLPVDDNYNYVAQNKYIFILNAFVNGFVQLKLCADKIDYEYIIEIYWSNEARSYVKRTYDDFVLFHKKLLNTFSEYFNGKNNNNRPIESICFNKDSRKKANSNVFQFMHRDDQFSIPTLPVSKKRFWMSHLKLAELREVELNTYVQRLLKLPLKISHSRTVIEFFESLCSDPKPADYLNIKSPEAIKNETGSDSLEDDRDRESDDESDYLQNNTNEASESNFGDEDINRFRENYSSTDDEDNNQDQDDVEEEDDEEETSPEKEPNRNTSEMARIANQNGLNSMSTSLIYIKNSRKKEKKESALWWDEDNALNELTTSASLEFGSQFNLSQYNQTKFNSKIKQYEQNEQNELDEDIETLKTLESIIQNSDLFGAN